MPRTLSVALAGLLASAPALPIEDHYPQATLRGFPDLSDEHGKKIADGVLTQWVEKGKLHVRLAWEFPSGRLVEEQAVLRQQPELVQESWSFEDREGGRVSRRFDVDFVLGRAAGFKIEKDGKRQGWSEKIDLEAVVFMPKPRTAGVELSLSGERTLRRGGKSLAADIVTLHPKAPWPINKLVGARDIHLWYYHGAPPQLLRAEAPLAEVKDPMVRIDVLPGGERLAKPSARPARR